MRKIEVGIKDAEYVLAQQEGVEDLSGSIDAQAAKPRSESIMLNILMIINLTIFRNQIRVFGGSEAAQAFGDKLFYCKDL